MNRNLTASLALSLAVSTHLFAAKTAPVTVTDTAPSLGAACSDVASPSNMYTVDVSTGAMLRCSGGVWSTWITSGAPTTTKYAKSYILSGSGTTASPYVIDWASALTARTELIFSKKDDGTTSYFDTPDTEIVIPSNVTLRGDGNSVLMFTPWGTTRPAPYGAMFSIPAGTSHVKIDGLLFDPGLSSISAVGVADGGGSYVSIGTAGNATPAVDIEIVNCKFGMMRMGLVVGTGHNGQHIGIVGSANGVNVHHNTFDRSPDVINTACENNVTAPTVNGFNFSDNTVEFTDASQCESMLDPGPISACWHYGNVVQLSVGCTALTQIQGINNDVMISNNLIKGVNGGIEIGVTGSRFVVSDNILISDYLDFCMMVSPETDATNGVSDVSVTGNVCSGDDATHVASGLEGSPDIWFNKVTRGTMANNVAYGYGMLLRVQNSSDVVVSGNISEQRFGYADGLYADNNTRMTITGNEIKNAGGYGMRITNASSTIVSNNIVTETLTPSVLATAVAVGCTPTPCEGVVISGNTVRTAATPYSWYSFPAGSVYFGNSGFVGSTLTIAPTFTGTISSVSSLQTSEAAGLHAGGSSTANTTFYGGGEIVSEGTVAGPGTDATNSEGYIRFPAWSGGDSVYTFPNPASTGKTLALVDATSGAIARTDVSGLGTVSQLNTIKPSDLTAGTTPSVGQCPSRDATDQFVWGTCGGGGVSNGDYGDINVTGSVWTIRDGTVTTGKILNGTILNADIGDAAAIVDTKLGPISTVGKVSNSATTADSANTVGAIVARDVNGDFSARNVNVLSVQASGTGDNQRGIESVDNGTACGDPASLSTSICTIGGRLYTKDSGTTSIKLPYTDQSQSWSAAQTFQAGMVLGNGTDSNYTVTVDRAGTDPTIAWNDSLGWFRIGNANLAFSDITGTSQQRGIFFPVTAGNPFATKMFIGAQSGANAYDGLDDTLCMAFNSDCNGARVDTGQWAGKFQLEGSYDFDGTANAVYIPTVELNYDFISAAGAVWRPMYGLVDSTKRSSGGQGLWQWRVFGSASGTNAMRLQPKSDTSNLVTLQVNSKDTESGSTSGILNLLGSSSDLGSANSLYGVDAIITGDQSGDYSSSEFIGVRASATFSSTATPSGVALVAGGRFTGAFTGSVDARSVDQVKGLEVFATNSQTGTQSTPTYDSAMYGIDLTLTPSAQNVKMGEVYGLRINGLGTKGTGATWSNVAGIKILDLGEQGSNTDATIMVDSQTGGSGNKGHIRMMGGDATTGHLLLGSGHLWYDTTNSVYRTSTTAEGADNTNGHPLLRSSAGNIIIAKCGNVSVDPPNIGTTSTSGTATSAVTGLAANDACTCSPRADFNDDLILKYCYATANNLNVVLYNLSGGALDATAQTVDYCCFSK
jgi:hypothetical protein